MVQTITPVVHGGRARWGLSIGAHAVGATLSAAALGAALGGVGAVLGAPWGSFGVAVVAVIALAFAGRELLGLRVPLPNLQRQVPDWWRTFFSPVIASFLYGLGLGVGFLTYLSFGTLVAVAAIAIASGSSLLGAVLLGSFGLARGLSVLVSASATKTELVGSVTDRLDRLALSRWPRLVNGAILAVVAAVAAAEPAKGGSIPGSGAGVIALACVFGVAAVAKLTRSAEWRVALEGYALGPVKPVAAVGVPVAEFCVVALAISGLARPAAWLAIALVAAFSVAIVRAARRRPGRLPCGCFGSRATRSPSALLARNALLLVLAALVAAAPGQSRFGILHAPTGHEIVPTVLVLVGGTVALAVLRAAFELARPRHRH